MKGGRLLTILAAVFEMLDGFIEVRFQLLEFIKFLVFLCCF
jgi:hypothetical protein